MAAPSRVEPEELRRLCLDAAQQAGSLVVGLRRANDVNVTSTKTSVTDIVTNADNAAEQLLRSILLGARSDDAWLGEETGTTIGVEHASQVRWIVDPIDGTVNYLYDLPGWGISVAAEVDGIVVAGAVVVPTTGECFSAHLGGGATCNDRTLAASSCDALPEALVATGFSYEPGVRTAQGQALAALLPRVRDIRRLGAASVDLCSLAAGRVDAYYERGLKAWDRAAGVLIALEAGAVVVEDDSGGVVGAGPRLMQPFRDLLAEVGA